MNEQEKEERTEEPTPEEIKRIREEEDRYYIQEAVNNGCFV